MSHIGFKARKPGKATLRTNATSSPAKTDQLYEKQWRGSCIYGRAGQTPTPYVPRVEYGDVRCRPGVFLVSQLSGQAVWSLRRRKSDMFEGSSGCLRSTSVHCAVSSKLDRKDDIIPSLGAVQLCRRKRFLGHWEICRPPSSVDKLVAVVVSRER